MADLAARTGRRARLDVSVSKVEIVASTAAPARATRPWASQSARPCSSARAGRRLLLDPVYTGRAMAGLIDLVRNGEIRKSETVLFWHTGGTAALYAYSEEILARSQAADH